MDGMDNPGWRLPVIAGTCALALLLCVPQASAVDTSSLGVTMSIRTFHPSSSASDRKTLLQESVSTSVENDSQWSMESLTVPQTESTAEKEAEKRAEEKQQQQSAEEAETVRQTTALAASDATPLSTGLDAPSTASATGQAIATYATQFVGYPYVAGGNTPAGWDCSGFVQYVFAQFGISLPHYSGSQAASGTAVGSLSEAAPGDIIANAGHAAIYIGNGLVVNALNPSQGTQITGLNVFNGSYSIRRIV